jgi:hypothetical protein
MLDVNVYFEFLNSCLEVTQIISASGYEITPVAFRCFPLLCSKIMSEVYLNSSSDLHMSKVIYNLGPCNLRGFEIVEGFKCL